MRTDCKVVSLISINLTKRHACKKSWKIRTSSSLCYSYTDSITSGYTLQVYQHWCLHLGDGVRKSQTGPYYDNNTNTDRIVSRYTCKDNNRANGQELSWLLLLTIWSQSQGMGENWYSNRQQRTTVSYNIVEIRTGSYLDTLYRSTSIMFTVTTWS
jgi:hypothetical protein